MNEADSTVPPDHALVKKGNHTTHGKSGSRAHRIWKQMKGRCLNPNHHAFHDYGGRGITICKEWLKFEGFFKDMGDPPDGFQIERKDNNKGYEPNNCKWATRAEQARNKRSNVMIELNGQSRCASDWAELTGMNYFTIIRRVNLGWSADKILSAPVAPRPQHHPKVSHDGLLMTCSEWAKKVGLPNGGIIRKRISRGWSVHDSITTPHRDI